MLVKVAACYGIIGYRLSVIAGKPDMQRRKQ
jgi:hypothetical protein